MTPPEFTQQDAIRQRDVLAAMLHLIGEALGRQHWSGGPAGFSAGDVIKRLMPQEVPVMSEPPEVEAALQVWQERFASAEATRCQALGGEYSEEGADVMELICRGRSDSAGTIADAIREAPRP